MQKSIAHLKGYIYAKRTMANHFLVKMEILSGIRKPTKK